MILSENDSPRYRRIIAALLSLYPWLLMVLVFLNVRDKPAGGFFSAGAAFACALAALSFINIIISIIFIMLVNVFITTREKGNAGYFWAINSISLLWIISPIFNL
ncbi:hypothetical protein [Klebsiella oxytoca]|uniref:Uncharacterized protein n=1 Tax=Klebsiella oxytoca TaxID=571 RepID=A0A6B8N1P0_KLEOX|nr:hypothetical protein [Klebsiella oxytoca]QGN39518.1 hypothetical protein GJ746_20435 [Klebsiella oxytoca]